MAGPTTVVAHSALEWLQILGLGGLVGALGQGARTVVGLKKLNDAASGSDALNVSDLIVASRLVISFAIGAVAGAAAAIGTIDSLTAISTEAILGIAAAGYAGADFIEGFISRVTASPAAPAGQEAIGTGGAGGAQVATDADAVG